ncbi:NUDIX domain-containing protein [Terribacillus sp. 7520-G]|uniref:NUDIX hydrolase n=1 Tax=unclassified Terribacillus TaxID=2636508 RepID=UPI0013043503|nr:NUDIX domain-containing protein [Terribacillus sp. 7520-G]
MVEKVLAYIIRNHKDIQQLLVHTHRDIPEAGRQIPGGTVDPGEDLLDALHREIFEESGLQDLPAAEMLGSAPFRHPHKQELQLRHFFVIPTKKPLPDTWEHQVFGNGADNGMIFRYRWMDLQAIPPLAASQDQFLHQLRKKTFKID